MHCRLVQLWYAGRDAVRNAIGYAKFYSRSNDAVIRVYDAGGDVIETREHKGDFEESTICSTLEIDHSVESHCFD
jgi:hypothetical protein